MKSLPDKQEEYIQYLYSVIDILKQKLRDFESQCKEHSGKLRHSEKICDEKEKFILFQESQLLELEDTINKLKQRILSLSNSNMSSAEGSGSRPRERSRSISQSRGILISLETLDTGQLLQRIDASATELFQYALGERALQNAGEAQHLKNTIARAVELVRERYDSIEDRTAQEIADLRARNFRLNESLQGAITELGDIENDDRETEALYQETLNNYNELQDGIKDILGEYWQVGVDNDELLYELERHLEWNRRELARRDDLLDAVNDMLDNCRQERDNILAHYRAEQILSRRLTRQKLLLKMTNRQLLIRLMNAPVIAPPPLPQPINQIWLLLQ